MAQSTKKLKPYKTDVQTELQTIRNKAKEFLANRKHANNLIDIISLCESDDEKIVIGCLKGFHKIFPSLISSGALYLDKMVDTTEDTDLSSDDKYKLWLQSRYTDVKNQLLELLQHPNQNVQELSICVLMKLVGSEGQNPLSKVDDKHLYFPAAFFQEIITKLLLSTISQQFLIERCQEYLEYDDVRYYIMKICLQDMRTKKNVTDTYLANVHALLHQITLPTANEEDTLKNFLSKYPAEKTGLKMNTIKEQKKMFTTLWLQFLRNKLPTSLYKIVLVNLHNRVMPLMTSPLLLSDFLTESYNIGGAISLLALNGLFILVNQYNLDYPDFYKKLYALFEPSVFHVKYKARFFYLSDLFLSSPLLPAYLVAAFAKRLARLGLTAPPTGLAIIVPFIYNLLIRHPSCKCLLHRPDGTQDITEDPYNMDEADMAKCGALESSLWELKSLQSHYYHSVSSSAKRSNDPMPRVELDISQHLEVSTEELFLKECKKRLKEDPAVTFEPASGLFGGCGDKFKISWALD